ncbi:MAG: hypothetical protein HEEMFOPI_00222 [Holosporales bacterium]
MKKVYTFFLLLTVQCLSKHVELVIEPAFIEVKSHMKCLHGASADFYNRLMGVLKHRTNYYVHKNNHNFWIVSNAQGKVLLKEKIHYSDCLDNLNNVLFEWDPVQNVYLEKNLTPLEQKVYVPEVVVVERRPQIAVNEAFIRERVVLGSMHDHLHRPRH